MNTDHMTLEGKIDPETLAKLRAICTAGWDLEYVASPDGIFASDTVAFRRHDRTVTSIIPWLARNIDFPKSSIIDFGAGCGSSALALSKVANSVKSFEIHGTSSIAFRRRMELFDVRNVEFTECPPETIFQRAADAVVQNTHIVLVAVVEHLLEHEQITYLKAFWDSLAPGNTLSIVETPNYLAYFDQHTFHKPFAHFVPDQLYSGWVRRSPESLRFRKSILARLDEGHIDVALQQRRRLGMGVTAEPFEQAFGCDLNEVVVADGFDEEMREWFPIKFDDKVLIAAFQHYNIELPIGFARRTLGFTFKKPISVEDAQRNKVWNSSRRSDICKKFSAIV